VALALEVFGAYDSYPALLTIFYEICLIRFGKRREKLSPIQARIGEHLRLNSIS